MIERARKELIVPIGLQALAIGGIVAAAASGRNAYWIYALGCAMLAAPLAVVIAWRLSARLRRLEKALQDGERMRLLGQVAGGLAHQLRNGVAGAKLATQLHARACTDDDGDSLDLARRQLARVEADLGRFLDLGRASSVRRPCRVVELVEEAVALLRPQCRHADVQMCWEPPAGDPVAMGDPGRLGHVVINLLTNAVEAAGAGGHVEATVDQNDHEMCILEVWDNGPGLSSKVARQLFQPFVTGKEDGIGLGLFVARQAAEEHGGRLDWRRERGRTCFRLEVPAGTGESVEQRVVAALRG